MKLLGIFGVGFNVKRLATDQTFLYSSNTGEKMGVQ
jgi:hypothetical protein